MVGFGVLGSLRLDRDGRTAEIPTAMLRRLLALLLIRAGTPISAGVLIDELWPEDPPETARRTLSVYVSRLRRLLGDDDRVEASAGFYAIRPRGDELDAAVFERLATEAAAALETGDHRHAEDLTRRALALWRGSAYDGIGGCAAITVEARRLDELRLNMIEQGIELDLKAGRHADVVDVVPKIITDHPYRERLHGRARAHRGGTGPSGRRGHLPASGDRGVRSESGAGAPSAGRRDRTHAIAVRRIASRRRRRAVRPVRCALSPRPLPLARPAGSSAATAPCTPPMCHPR